MEHSTDLNKSIWHGNQRRDDRRQSDVRPKASGWWFADCVIRKPVAWLRSRPRARSMIERSLCGMMLLCGGVGCDSKPELLPVQGTVMIDDKPLGEGSIMVAPSNGPMAYGKIEADGKFRLESRDGPGCVAGVHRVAITSIELLDGGNTIRHLVPERYNDFHSSDLSIEVGDEMQPPEIRLSSAGLSKRVYSSEGDVVPE